MAAANGTGTAAMLGRVEGGSAEQIEVAGSYCEACQRRVGFSGSVQTKSSLLKEKKSEDPMAKRPLI